MWHIICDFPLSTSLFSCFLYKAVNTNTIECHANIFLWLFLFKSEEKQAIRVRLTLFCVKQGEKTLVFVTSCNTKLKCFGVHNAKTETKNYQERADFK